MLNTPVVENVIILPDYSLIGRESKQAVEKGLADATWYISPVPRDKMLALLKRRDGPALRDTLLWFGLLFGSGYLVIRLWGSWWAILPYIVYSVIYGSSSDSRWHESSHGTPFKTNWMNNFLYEVASFMVFRQSTVWRWSHTRHHSDTLVRGRDPEIAAQRPANIKGILINFFALKSAPAEMRKLLLHARGRIHPEVANYLPGSEYKKVIRKARIYLVIYLAVIGASILTKSILPLMFIGLPTFLGSWLMPVYGLTQHAGLAENVLDHRLNCRTVYMNRIHRFLYWNMNYHVEHHMFPLVPYHALPGLHELMKEDCPKPYHGIVEAFREIIPTLLKQAKDPTYYIKRELPTPTISDNKTSGYRFVAKPGSISKEGLVEICAPGDIPPDDVIRFDCNEKSYAVYRIGNDHFYASDGICTHGNTHLAEGLVIGEQIECPKHNGRFNVRDGSVMRPPPCDALRSYKITVAEGKLYLDLQPAGGMELTEFPETTEFKVISNNNLAIYIKELILEPVEGKGFKYTPGDYIKLEIPEFSAGFHSIDINEPYVREWKKQNIFSYHSSNPAKTRRNYSMAGNPDTGNTLVFNVRIAIPPIGMNCNAGIGSSYVFQLRPGDLVRATGPFGDFHIKDNGRDIIYIGGGAGMAPIKAHISHLFDSLKTGRKVDYWYGARSLKELYYEEYFEELEKNNKNFSFHPVLSEPSPEDQWDSFTGLVHELVRKEHLQSCEDPAAFDYYLCGPPGMIKVTKEMLAEFRVPAEQVVSDEF